MTKKEYQKPVMEILEADLDQQILAVSVTTTGLDDDSREQTIAFIRKYLNGRLLIITSHDERGLDDLKIINVD